MWQNCSSFFLRLLSFNFYYLKKKILLTLKSLHKTKQTQTFSPRELLQSGTASMKKLLVHHFGPCGLRGILIIHQTTSILGQAFQDTAAPMA